MNLVAGTCTQVDRRAMSTTRRPLPFSCAGRWSKAPRCATSRATSASTSLTPTIDLDALITPRTEPGPLFDVKLQRDSRFSGRDRRAHEA